MNTVKTTMLLAAFTSVVVSLAYLVAGSLGISVDSVVFTVFALLLCGITNFIAYWNSGSIVLNMYGAVEIWPKDNPKLYGAVKKLAEDAGLPMPDVYIIRSNCPNAFATGRDPEHAAVAATQGMVDMLSDAELEGVLAHELAHIKNYDTLISCVAATLAGAVNVLARLFLSAQRHRGRRSNGKGGGIIALVALVAVLLTPIIAALIRMAISRGREYAADRDGALICGNPNALASALEKIENRIVEGSIADEDMEESELGAPATAHICIINNFRSGIMSRLFSTHPPTEKRVEKLRAM